MSDITLQEQIDFMKTAQFGGIHFAILASLKRLQAADGQEAILEIHQGRGGGWVRASSLEFNAYMGLNKRKLYALPPDAQGMIDKLTAERDELKQWKDEHATKPCEYCDGTGDVHSIDGEWRGECTACDALSSECEKLNAQRDALMLEYCPDEMSEEQIKEWGANQVVSGLSVSDAKSSAQSAKPVSKREAFDDWFQSQQDIAYDGMWSFAKAAWQARAALNQPAIPQGYTLVPIEPTPAMRRAIENESTYLFEVASHGQNVSIGAEKAVEMYKAMLAVAQQGASHAK